ncbi:MAG: hypothetical protein RR508_04180 [Oscillospiraceae bacterium]
MEDDGEKKKFFSTKEKVILACAIVVTIIFNNLLEAHHNEPELRSFIMSMYWLLFVCTTVANLIWHIKKGYGKNKVAKIIDIVGWVTIIAFFVRDICINWVIWVPYFLG